MALIGGRIACVLFEVFVPERVVDPGRLAVLYVAKCGSDSLLSHLYLLNPSFISRAIWVGFWNFAATAVFLVAAAPWTRFLDPSIFWYPACVYDLVQILLQTHRLPRLFRGTPIILLRFRIPNPQS